MARMAGPAWSKTVHSWIDCTSRRPNLLQGSRARVERISASSAASTTSKTFSPSPRGPPKMMNRLAASSSMNAACSGHWVCNRIPFVGSQASPLLRVTANNLFISCSSHLLKDSVSDDRFHVPINHCQRGKIESGVRNHQHRKLAGYGEDVCENETSDDRLLGAGKSLARIVRGTKQCGGEQHDEYFGPHTRSKKFAEPFEHPSAEKCLLPETGVDNHNKEHSRESSRVSSQEMIGLIDRRCAEQRHHDRFHQKFEHNAENDADDQRSRPILRSHVTDLAPWRARQPNPQHHQNGAERRNKRARQNEDDRENSEWPESAQSGGEAIVFCYRRNRCARAFECFIHRIVVPNQYPYPPWYLIMDESRE